MDLVGSFEPEPGSCNGPVQCSIRACNRVRSTRVSSGSGKPLAMVLRRLVHTCMYAAMHGFNTRRCVCVSRMKQNTYHRYWQTRSRVLSVQPIKIFCRALGRAVLQGLGTWVDAFCCSKGEALHTRSVSLRVTGNVEPQRSRLRNRKHCTRMGVHSLVGCNASATEGKGHNMCMLGYRAWWALHCV